MYTTFKDAKEFADTFPVGSKIKMKRWDDKDGLVIVNIFNTTGRVELSNGESSAFYFARDLVKEMWVLCGDSVKPYVTHGELEARCQHDYRVYQGFMRKQEEYEMVCFKCGEGK